MERVLNISGRFPPTYLSAVAQGMRQCNLEMQPFFLLFAMMFIRVVIPIHETERMQIQYLQNDVLLPLPEEREIHEEHNSQIKEDQMLVSEFLKRSGNSNELL